MNTISRGSLPTTVSVIRIEVYFLNAIRSRALILNSDKRRHETRRATRGTVQRSYLRPLHARAPITQRLALATATCASLANGNAPLFDETVPFGAARTTETCIGRSNFTSGPGYCTASQLSYCDRVSRECTARSDVSLARVSDCLSSIAPGHILA
ncbi:hypothetical protein PUN28_009634 [Cardiocondyla obscurior]|uniref:Uncharacterized protein n=1 Tax=Cardiocondyla obscurior TaxID=286306 RepID=A0AAW2FUP8_9HYME